MARKPSEKRQKERTAKSGAQSSATPKLFRSYFSNHVKVSKQSFSAHKSRPIATLLTCSVIGIALVLPTLLFVILSNFENADIEQREVEVNEINLMS